MVRLKVHILDGPAVMGLAVGDEDALGQHPDEHSGELDGPFAAPELGPGKHRGAQVVSGGGSNISRILSRRPALVAVRTHSGSAGLSGT